MKGCHKNTITNILRLYIKHEEDFDQIIKDLWYERFADKIEIKRWPDDCWYVRDFNNHLTTTIDGVCIYVYHISYIFHSGRIPTKILMHLCNNRFCINPDHLMAGTSKENTQYARMFHNKYYKDKEEGGYLNIDQAKKYIGFDSRDAVYYWVKKGILNRYEINGKFLLKENEIKLFKQRRELAQKTNNKIVA
jgi:hypothetical protein